MEPRKVIYLHSAALVQAADQLPANLGRASLVHGLIDSLELLHFASVDENEDGTSASTERGNKARAKVVASVPATREDLLKFHEAKFVGGCYPGVGDARLLLMLLAYDWVDRLLGTSSGSNSSDSDTSSQSGSESSRPSARKRRKKDAEFGLEDDCPEFHGLADYVLEVAGASITAARQLRDGDCDIAISWTGGRHHAKRGEAAGFCYVQDIVLAILELRKPPLPRPITPSSAPTPQPTNSRLTRILYLDLDLHHGDGVESAFFSTATTLTLSLHLHSPLFFPSTGSLHSSGPSPPNPAALHALNLALHPGLSENSLLRVFDTCVQPVYDSFRPQAVVLQCGVDGLAGDPCKEWNLNARGMGEVVKRVCGWGVKTLILGGGGYELQNTAKCWAYLTSCALGDPLDLDLPIPPDLEEYASFSPSFTLDVPSGNMQDHNTEMRLKEVEQVFETYVENLKKRYPR